MKYFILNNISYVIIGIVIIYFYINKKEKFMSSIQNNQRISTSFNGLIDNVEYNKHQLKTLQSKLAKFYPEQSSLSKYKIVRLVQSAFFAMTRLFYSKTIKTLKADIVKAVNTLKCSEINQYQARKNFSLVLAELPQHKAKTQFANVLAELKQRQSKKEAAPRSVMMKDVAKVACALTAVAACAALAAPIVAIALAVINKSVAQNLGILGIQQ